MTEKGGSDDLLLNLQPDEFEALEALVRGLDLPFDFSDLDQQQHLQHPNVVPAPSQVVSEQQQQQQSQPKPAKKRAAPAEMNEDGSGLSHWALKRLKKKEEEEATARLVEQLKERITELEARNEQLTQWITGLALLGHHYPVCQAVRVVPPPPVEAATAAQL